MNDEEKNINALERVKELLDSAKNQGHIIVRVEDIENTFPELQESEDDRIRKDIIRVFKGEIPFTSEKENEKYIVWIERQNKKLDPDKVIEWLKHCNLCDWDIRTSIIPDSSPTSIPHRVRWLSDDFINKFKKDFEI